MNNCGIFQFCELKNEIQILEKRHLFTGLRPVPLPFAGEVFWTANGRPYGWEVRADVGISPYGGA